MPCVEGAHELHDQADTSVLARGGGNIARWVHTDNIGLLSNTVTEVEELVEQVKDTHDKDWLMLHELAENPRRRPTLGMVLDTEASQT